MGDINRKPSEAHFHRVHTHVCPACQRPYTCNCAAQYDKQGLVCRDCETGTYDPMIHGGRGEKREA